MTLLFKTICGSNLYGTALEGSDIDIGTIIVEGQEQLFGIDKTEKIPQQITETHDNQTHYLRRFAYLCARGNPNTFEWLFSSKIEYISDIFYRNIFHKRSRFLGLTNLRASHFGFANAQIKKMFVYASDRGAARKELIDNYGYDLKYAAHSLRLIWQLESLVRIHEIVFPYSKEVIETLVAIKSGALSKQSFLDLYNDESKRVEELCDRNPFHLPQEPDYKEINNSLIDFYREYYGV